MKSEDKIKTIEHCLEVGQIDKDCCFFQCGNAEQSWQSALRCALSIIECKESESKELWSERCRIYQTLLHNDKEFQAYRKTYKDVVNELERYKQIVGILTVDSRGKAQLVRDGNVNEYKKVVHGSWSIGKEPSGSVYAHCSACNRKMNSYCYGYAHCPLCGARMDGGDSE